MTRGYARTIGPRLARRRLLAAAGSGGAAAALLAACGGDKTSSESGSGGAVQEATIVSGARTAEQGQPKPGGTLNIHTSGNAPLDP